MEIYPDALDSTALDTIKELLEAVHHRDGWYRTEIDDRWEALETAFDAARHEDREQFDKTDIEESRLAGHQHVTLVPVHHRAPTQLKARADHDRDRANTNDQPGGTGAPLPNELRGQMERTFGTDFSTVRYRETAAPEQLDADAFAQGEELHFAPGMFQPGTASGQRLIGHELAHVVQQRAGRVAAPQGHGGNINADAALEREADEHGELAARGEQIAGTPPDARLAGDGAVQLMRRQKPTKTKTDKTEATGLGTPEVMKHIFGEEHDDGTLVGYHSEIAGRDKYTVDNISCYPHGFYTGTVKTKQARKGKKAGSVVKQSSTFFPIDWDAARIKVALDRAVPVQGGYALDQRDGGYLLTGNAAGYYPNLYNVSQLANRETRLAIEAHDEWAKRPSSSSKDEEL
jgi:hypothetical protein